MFQLKASLGDGLIEARERTMVETIKARLFDRLFLRGMICTASEAPPFGFSWGLRQPGCGVDVSSFGASEIHMPPQVRPAPGKYLLPRWPTESIK